MTYASDSLVSAAIIQKSRPAIPTEKICKIRNLKIIKKNKVGMYWKTRIKIKNKKWIITNK